MGVSPTRDLIRLFSLELRFGFSEFHFVACLALEQLGHRQLPHLPSYWVAFVSNWTQGMWYASPHFLHINIFGDFPNVSHTSHKRNVCCSDPSGSSVIILQWALEPSNYGLRHWRIYPLICLLSSKALECPTFMRAVILFGKLNPLVVFPWLVVSARLALAW